MPCFAPAILKVVHFLDSQISGEVIHRWDGAFAIPSGWFGRGLRDFSGPPEGAERQYRDGGFRCGGLRPVFHVSVILLFDVLCFPLFDGPMGEFGKSAPDATQ